MEIGGDPVVPGKVLRKYDEALREIRHAIPIHEFEVLKAFCAVLGPLPFAVLAEHMALMAVGRGLQRVLKKSVGALQAARGHRQEGIANCADLAGI